MTGGSRPTDGGEPEAYFGGPLQLVRIDEEGKLHLQEDAVAILQQIKGRLAVVSIAGLYRTGKSFLLNRVLGLQDGFEVGPTVNPCTRGLWIWGQPVRLAEDFHCVLVDAEGLGSASRTTSCDLQIMSLCVLLSSCFIYNSVGAIDEQAIDDLHLVLQLAKHIHVRSGRTGESSELALYLPRFLWVLRDFHLRLVDERGERISEKEYLENALKPVPGCDAKNEVRSTLRDLFRERDCSALVRPLADEADLANVQRVPYESLRPDFRSQVEAFVKKVYGSLKPKKIDGTHVSGALLAQLASEYCQAINAGAVPSIHSSWASAVQQQLRTSLREAVHLYRERMNEEVMKCLPVEEDDLRSSHKSAKAVAEKLLLAPNLAGNPAFSGYQAELRARCGQLRDHAVGENAQASRRLCERLARELYDSRIDAQLGAQRSPASFGRLLEDWEEVKQAYLERAKGPAKHEVLINWLLKRQAESIRLVSDGYHSAIEEQQAALQHRVMEAEAVRNDDCKEDSKKADGLEGAKKRWIGDKIKMEVRLRDMRREMEESSRRAGLEKAKLEDAARTCREQVKGLQERLRAADAKSEAIKAEACSTVKAELQSLESAIVSGMTEARATDVDGRELRLKARHERQLLGLEREFCRRLAAARKESDGRLEDVKTVYDNKVESMQQYQSEIMARNCELEKQLEKALGDVELLRQQKVRGDREHHLQHEFVRHAERQVRCVTSFLERSLPSPNSPTALGDELGEGARLGNLGKQDSFSARYGPSAERSGRSPLESAAQRPRAFEGGA